MGVHIEEQLRSEQARQNVLNAVQVNSNRVGFIGGESIELCLRRIDDEILLSD